MPQFRDNGVGPKQYLISREDCDIFLAILDECLGAGDEIFQWKHQAQQLGLENAEDAEDAFKRTLDNLQQGRKMHELRFYLASEGDKVGGGASGPEHKCHPVGSTNALGVYLLFGCLLLLCSLNLQLYLRGVLE